MTPGVLLSIALGLLFVPQAAAEEPLRSREVAPGVHVLGSSARFESANAGWIGFADHALLIGAPHPELLARSRAEIERTIHKPLRGAVLTHLRTGEIESARLLLRDGIPLYLAAGLATELRSALSREAAASGAARETRLDLREFEERLELGEGAARLELIALGNAAGPGGAAAYFPGSRVLFTGEACVHGPRADLSRSDTAAWVEVLARLRKLEPLVVVPGFGSIADAEAIERQERFLRELRRQVGWRIAYGSDLAAIRSEVRMPPEWLVWMPYDDPTPADIEHVHRELTAPLAPFGRRPFREAGTRPRALALVGDRVHDPEHIEAGLRGAFAEAGVTARFLVDYRGLTAENLKSVELLVILRDGSTWPDGPEKPYRTWMTPEQEQAVADFVAAGGGLLALHNATGLYPEGGPYLRLLGGTYNGHGPLERFRVRVVDEAHPIARGVSEYEIADEQHTPVPDRSRVRIFLESRSDEGVTAAAGWSHEHGRGRVAYLANGHTRESLVHPMVRRLLRNALRWCARRGDHD